MSSNDPGRGPWRQRPVRWRPRTPPLAAGVTAAFLGLCGFLGVRVATGDDPALRTVGSAGERDASAQVAPRRDDDEAADGIGVLVDVGRALFGEEDEEGSRDTPANPSTGTSD
jgi:hypothetical protein